MSNDITTKEGHMYGGWRQPVNAWIAVKGSIHEDKTAQNIGMRGGTIPGTIHLNLFPPLLLRAFGERWFERGTLSMYYTYATTDRESVRAVIGIPTEGSQDAQVEAWVETPEGNTVAKGTASVGDPKEPSYLHTVELKNAKPEELRILSSFRAEQEMVTRDVLITQEDVDESLKIITDPLDWYRGKSPWGNAILPPAMMYTAMLARAAGPDGRPVAEVEASGLFGAVGFFGATELRNVNGPIKVGVPYRASGKLICVGASPKTEYLWYDSQLHEKDTGKLVAEMRQMDRLMKASSALYAGRA